MDTKQIEYILTIAEEKNITHAANKLFITQSALNQQLIKLEKELGTPLFYRSKSHVHPTEAGEIYIENAREIMRIKSNAYQHILDLTESKCGRLCVGFTHGRGVAMFTSVYIKFHQLYPNIEVIPREDTVRSLQKLILQGDVDLGFLTLTDVDKANLVYDKIATEELLIAIPSTHPLANRPIPDGKMFATLDPYELRNESFVLINRHSTMRTEIDKIFAAAGFYPKVLFETSNNYTVLSMIQSGFCCSIISSYYAQNMPDGVSWFHLPSRPQWNLYASYRSDHYKSAAGRCFIDLVSSQFAEQSLKISDSILDD